MSQGNKKGIMEHSKAKLAYQPKVIVLLKDMKINKKWIQANALADERVRLRRT